jgi:hypothetical protein
VNFILSIMDVQQPPPQQQQQNEVKTVLLLVRSTNVQVFPPQYHQCGVPTGTFQPGGGISVAFFEEKGSYLLWSCTQCEYFAFFSMACLIQGSANHDLLFAMQPDGRIGSHMFLGTNEWRRRTGLTLTNERLAQLMLAL